MKEYVSPKIEIIKYLPDEILLLSNEDDGKWEPEIHKP